MHAEPKTLRLLIVDDCAHNAERIFELFRATGHSLQAQHVSSLEALNRALKTPWDVCIAAHRCQNAPSVAALNCIQQQRSDISFIQLTQDNSSAALTAALHDGAQDAVYQADEQRLILVVQRELAHLAERRQRRAVEIALKTTQQRYQAAIDSAGFAAQLRQLSSQDLVTGLYNRQHFLQQLDAASERAINIGQPASLAYIKVDHYSQLQVQLGLAAIDLFLLDLAKLLRQHLKHGAHLARLADNAFSLLTPDTSPEDDKAQLLNLIKRVEAQLFDINGRSAQTTLSIGVARLGEKSAHASTVLKRAQHCAEQLSQGNGLKIYNPADDLAATAKRGEVLAMLHQALEHNSFKLLFQPIVALHAGPDQLYEVLPQLVSPRGHNIPRAEYLDAALGAGLAEKIDRWVLLNAIQQLSKQHQQGLTTRLFIPLSSASLNDKTLMVWLAEVLKASPLAAHSLILQLRESDAISHLKHAKALSRGLQPLQCQLALEQFGGAANPLAIFKHLPLDFVKLEHSFSAQLNQPAAQHRLTDLLTLLHRQDSRSIVPNINSASILPALWQAGVQYIQGCYLQEPSPNMHYDFALNDQ